MLETYIKDAAAAGDRVIAGCHAVKIRKSKTGDLTLNSSHSQGGNAMSDDPAKGVADSRFRVHGYENLFVADASVFPTTIRVNPQLTIGPCRTMRGITGSLNNGARLVGATMRAAPAAVSGGAWDRQPR